MGHTGEVTGVAFHPAHPGGQVLLTSSLDGTLRAWSTADGAPFGASPVMPAPGPVESMAVPPARQGARKANDVVYVSCWYRRVEGLGGGGEKEKEKEGESTDHSGAGYEGGRVHAYSLGKCKAIERLAKTATPPPLAVSPRGTFLGAHERRTVTLWSLVRSSAAVSASKAAAGGSASSSSPASHRSCLRLHHTKPITALAFDQRDETVAAGDSTGRVLFWHGFAAATAAVAAAGAIAGRGGEQEGAAGHGGGPGDALPCTTLHWHAQAVGCLSFTSDGAYLLSGGAESVLVLWQLESGRRSYLPRLGGGLRSIAHFPRDPSRVALAGADNASRVVSLASLTVEAIVRGVRPATLRPLSLAAHPAAAVAAATLERNARAAADDATMFRRIRIATQPSPAVAFDPGSGAVALASAGAGLQLYDPIGDAHVADLDIAPRNAVSGDGGPDDPMEPYVSHAAFTADGAYLVTVDRRSDRPMPGLGVERAASNDDDDVHARLGAAAFSGQPEETLRIWERTGGVGFECVCVCDAPHAAAVTSVSVRSDAVRGAMACTVSADGDLKTWAPVGAARGGERAGWRCVAAASHPGEPAPGLTACAFSQDGSLLATAGVDVALWDPDACARLRVLSPPDWRRSSDSSGRSGRSGRAAPMTGVAFVAGQPLLVAASPDGMVVWNLMSFTVWRAIAMPCVAVAAHPNLSTFAVTVVSPAAAAAEIDPSSDPSTHPGAASPRGGLVAQFAGADAAPVRCWATPGGAPQAVLLPEAAGGGLVVVTHDRRLVAEGWATSDASESSDELSDAAATPGGRGAAVAGAKLKAFGGESLAAHEGRLRTDGGAVASAIGANAKAGGGAAWGDLFDSPSHALPPLTTLAPHFLDALLERQSIAAD